MCNNKQVQIQRKCGCCKENIYIGNENIDEAIYYDNKTYHSRCFINICDKRSKMSNKSIAQKWTNILNNLDNIKQESKKHLSVAITKESIFDFIKDAYDITIIPTTIWQKLSDIYNGSFKGMTYGIPPEHLLDMWHRKINMLNRIARNNITKGIVMSPDKRISYDLSILVGKYDSYLKWIEKQKILESERKSEDNENIIGKSVGTVIKNLNRCGKSNSEDISDLVDDIFGE